MNLWMPMWKSNNKLDGKNRHLIKFHFARFDKALVFHTRRECRKFIEDNYGYIKHRKDLRSEPHGWRLPEAVKVEIVEYENDTTTEDSEGISDE